MTFSEAIDGMNLSNLISLSSLIDLGEKVFYDNHKQNIANALIKAGETQLANAFCAHFAIEVPTDNRQESDTNIPEKNS